jgi:hypothetical protein
MDRSDEARARAEARKALHRSQRPDPLAERVRIIGFWRECAKANRHYLPYCGAWWHPFVTQPGLRRLLMPKLRARIEEKIRARQQQYAAEMREAAQRFAKLNGEVLRQRWPVGQLQRADAHPADKGPHGPGDGSRRAVPHRRHRHAHAAAARAGTGAGLRRRLPARGPHMGRPLPKHAQVRMIGNSVCPPMAQALVAANYSERQALRAAA